MRRRYKNRIRASRSSQKRRLQSSTLQVRFSEVQVELQTLQATLADLHRQDAVQRATIAALQQEREQQRNLICMLQSENACLRSVRGHGQKKKTRPLSDVLSLGHSTSLLPSLFPSLSPMFLLFLPQADVHDGRAAQHDETRVASLSAEHQPPCIGRPQRHMDDSVEHLICGTASRTACEAEGAGSDF